MILGEETSTAGVYFNRLHGALQRVLVGEAVPGGNRMLQFVTWRQEAAGMSHTRTVPSMEELSSHRASWLMTTPVTRSLCPLKRRTILTASTSYLQQLQC